MRAGAPQDWLYVLPAGDVLRTSRGGAGAGKFADFNGNASCC